MAYTIKFSKTATFKVLFFSLLPKLYKILVNGYFQGKFEFVEQ